MGWDFGVLGGRAPLLKIPYGIITGRDLHRSKIYAILFFTWNGSVPSFIQSAFAETHSRSEHSNRKNYARRRENVFICMEKLYLQM